VDGSGEFHALAALPLGTAPGTNLIGGSVDPRPGLEAVAKEKYPIIPPAGN